MPATPQSPPARRTRSRAKALEETKTTKISTPGAKAASQKTRRKNTFGEKQTAANEDLETQQVELSAELSGESTIPQAKKAAAKNTAISTSKAPSATTDTNITNGTRSNRGRPRKNNQPVTNEQVQPITRTTRAKTESVNGTRSTAATLHATKKKVTFEDRGESDKENVPEMQEKSDTNADTVKAKDGQGIQAKPVRKAALKKTNRTAPATRGPNKAVEEKPRGEPLSPKKDTQVAKAKMTEDTEQDHQSRTKSPPKSLQESSFPVNQSPIKEDMENPDQLGISIDELQLPMNDCTSPSKLVGNSISASPRRPPSPFKEALKSPPVLLGDISENLVSNKGPHTSGTILLSKSPKKIALGEAQTHPVFEPTESVLNKSTLKSPARKPTSPIKGLIFRRSPEKFQNSLTKSSSTIATGVSGSPRKFGASETVISSPLRAERSSYASAKVYKMTPGEQTKMLEDELAISHPYFSPLKANGTGKRVNEISNSKPDCQKSTSPSKKSKIPVKSPTRSSPNSGVFESVKAPEYQQTPSSEQFASFLPKKLNFTTNNTDFTLDEDSEDELQSNDPKYNASPSPSRRKALDLPTTPSNLALCDGPAGSMTALAERFDRWQGASPDEKIVELRKLERPIFSPLRPNTDIIQDQTKEPEVILSPPQTSYFEEAMAVREDEVNESIQEQTDMHQGDEVFRQSQTSDASQEYGDENAIPIDPMLVDMNAMQSKTCTPEKLVTLQPNIIHTISKVPLKAADDDQALQIPKASKRSKSLAHSLSPHGSLELEMLRQINPPCSTELRTNTLNGPVTSKFSEIMGGNNDEISKLETEPALPATPAPKYGTWSTSATPARTPRPGLNTQLLSGAVVYVDVHTTEGADASGIFVELLGQMGARCVKSWSWNPRASSNGFTSNDEPEERGNNKVGITHVVFKDGGKRTMEKVREAKGVVMCVGVGWVLDCERENKWLDEADYAVDISTIPRGGHRRRKSMEPRLLASHEANIFSHEQTNKEPMSPTKAFLKFDSPSGSRRQTISLPSPEHREFAGFIVGLDQAEAPFTPGKAQFDTQQQNSTPYKEMESEFGSPATPYFLDPQHLTQQTCPPKQSQEFFFPLSGKIEDQPNESMRQRLMAARRKSLQWAPKVGSPLAKEDSERFDRDP